MAMPVIVSLLGKAAANTAVQSAAQKLVSDVYGRVMGPREDIGTSGAVDLDRLATREEVAASFALLQAELDARFIRLTRLAMAASVVQIVALGLIVALTR